jgi:hypothetical protein
LRSHRAFRPDAIALAFVGYTNLPGNHLRFAMLSISNQAPYPVHLRGEWVEVEGTPYQLARVMNTNLPHALLPVMKSGTSQKLAVGEPSSESETARWRFAVSFSRYTMQEQWIDLVWRYRLTLPRGIMRKTFAAQQAILDSSNDVTITTSWLTKGD